jgi:hypothetical protein
MRSKAEIEAEIEKLEQDIFIHEMKDHWDHLDFIENSRMVERLNELQKELADGGRKEL